MANSSNSSVITSYKNIKYNKIWEIVCKDRLSCENRRVTSSGQQSKILTGNSTVKILYEGLSVDGKKILECMLNKWSGEKMLSVHSAIFFSEAEKQSLFLKIWFNETVRNLILILHYGYMLYTTETYYKI